MADMASSSSTSSSRSSTLPPVGDAPARGPGLNNRSGCVFSGESRTEVEHGFKRLK